MSAPIIPSKTLPQTPATEWSNQTTMALGVMPTKEKETMLPGSYPEEPPKPADSYETAVSAVEAAKSYIPAPEEVQRALANAGEVAAAYLPESVSSYFSVQNASSQATPPTIEKPKSGSETKSPLVHSQATPPTIEKPASGSETTSTPGHTILEPTVVKLPEEKAISPGTVQDSIPPPSHAPSAMII